MQRMVVWQWGRPHVYIHVNKLVHVQQDSQKKNFDFSW